jgi:peptidoglycan/LPS O-acetylase OafA/YrhL
LRFFDERQTFTSFRFLSAVMVILIVSALAHHLVEQPAYRLVKARIASLRWRKLDLRHQV